MLVSGLKVDQEFIALQPRLLALAYRMLGSVSDAEDAVQETWLKWQSAGKPILEYPLAYFSKIVTRICLDSLRKVSKKRESYVGMWLPEPLDGRWSMSEYSCEDIEVMDVSYALMMTLESLSALERAAYLLHDVFEVPFSDISETLERTPATCRKLAARARENIQKAEQRYKPAEKEMADLLQVFQVASKTGDLEPLRDLLAEHVLFHSDGGGKVIAALNVIKGRDKVFRYLVGLVEKYYLNKKHQIEVVVANDSPSFALTDQIGNRELLLFDLDQEGRIANFYAMRNPDKLTGFEM